MPNSRACAPVALCILVVVGLGQTLAATAGPEAVFRPTQNDLLIRGGTGVAKAAVDTVLLMGPTGSGAAYIGDFEVGWNGWTSVDNTQVTGTHWQVSDFNQAVPGDLAAWCGDPVYPACPDSGDVAGGYGNNWGELLVRTAAVAVPGQSATVRVQADLQIDVEPIYERVSLSVRRQGELGWRDIAWWDGDLDLSVDETTAYLPAELLQGSGVVVAFRFVSDEIYSDEDCLYPSAGALQVDDITFTISQSGRPDLVSFTDFQDGTFGGWGTATDNNVGDFAQRWTGLEDVDPCRTNYSTQVAFIDDGVVVPGTGGSFCLNWCYGPNGYIVTTTGGLAGLTGHIDNAIVSPVLTLPVGAGEGVLLAWDEYVHEDLSYDSPGIFTYWGVRSADTDGSAGPVQELGDQDFVSDNLIGYGGPHYVRREHDLTSRIVRGADVIQVRLGVLDLGWVWGWLGDDGYPAPYFDNVALKIFPYDGPVIAASERELAQDAFPEQDALTYEDPGRMHVRFDMAGSEPVSGGVVAGDSIVVDVVARRAGATLLGDPELHYVIDANPAFDAYRTTPTSGVVVGWPVTIPGGAILDGSWAFDLPDTGTLFPGDILHYYIRAADSVAGDIRAATLPADLTGFGDFATHRSYDRIFTVDALPGLARDEFGTWREPEILYWDDGGRQAGYDAWLDAIEEAGYDSYDVYVTLGASRNLRNGLGGRTTGPCLDPYDAIVYGSGIMFETLSAGEPITEVGSDFAALGAWLAAGNRGLLLAGDELASDLAWDQGAAGAAFLSDVVGVSVASWSLRELIGNQAVPTVKAIPGNPAIGLLDAYVAYGGCPGLNSFDAATALPGTERLAEFLDPAGNEGAYPYAAATGKVFPSGNVVVSLPYDLEFVYPSPTWPPFTPRSAASLLLEDLLRYTGTLPPECPNGDCPPVPDVLAFAVRCAPNPFNPATRLSYTVPVPGHLTVKVYDLRGRLVRTLVDDRVNADGSVVWDGRDEDGAAVASGVYFTEARLNGEVRVGKLALVK